MCTSIGSTLPRPFFKSSSNPPEKHEPYVVWPRVVSRRGGCPDPPLISKKKDSQLKKYCYNCRKTSNSLGTQKKRVGISIKWHCCTIRASLILIVHWHHYKFVPRWCRLDSSTLIKNIPKTNGSLSLKNKDLSWKRAWYSTKTWCIVYQAGNWRSARSNYMTFISIWWLCSEAYILFHYYWHNKPSHIWWSWQLHGVRTEKLTRSPKYCA